MRNTRTTSRREICMKLIHTLVFLFFLLNYSVAQTKIYEASFNGGVTGDGHSPNDNTSSGGTFDIQIPPGSTILQAYFLAGRHGNAANIPVIFNGTWLYLNNTNQMSPTFNSPAYGGASNVHVIDVTSLIDPTDNSYTLSIYPQNPVNNRYSDFYLFVAYSNPTYPITNCAIYLNDNDFAGVLPYSNMTVNSPMNLSCEIGVSLFGGYMCSVGSLDATDVKINGTNIGQIGGADAGSGSCGGVKGSFYYENNTLYGLNDDNATPSMSGSDGLLLAQSYMNSVNTFDMEFIHSTGSASNSVWAVFLAYGDCITALNVSMKNIEMKCVEEELLIDWVTSSETDCDYFRIEKSKDNEMFIYEGEVDGYGTTSQEQDYSYRSAIEREYSYYRLVEVDFNGEETVYNSYYVDCSNSELIVYPNPVLDELSIQFQGFQSNGTLIEIYDHSGRKIFHDAINTSGEYRMLTNFLANGVYTLIVSDSFHRELAKFIKM